MGYWGWLEAWRGEFYGERETRREPRFSGERKSWEEKRRVVVVAT
jgi:hypothetical protein